MWCAMGQCYENEALGADEAAVRCYRRAHLSGDREGAAPCAHTCTVPACACRDKDIAISCCLSACQN